MFLHGLFQALNQTVRGRRNRWRRRHSPVRRAKPWAGLVLQLEPLEDRMAPATLTVNTLLDSTTPSPFLSLRQAVNAVNAGTSAGLNAAEIAQITGPFGNNDTIDFGNLTGTIALTSNQQLSITRDVTIESGNANQLTISGNNGTRVFFVGSGVSVSLENLTVADGLADQGAGIYNAGSLDVSNSTLSSNTAMGGAGAEGDGGAIFNSLNATLVISGSELVNNEAMGGSANPNGAPAGVGGGLANQGTANIDGSLFLTNQAVGANGISGGGGGAAFGGAIANGGSDAHLELDNATTLTSNMAVGGTAGAGGAGGTAYGGAIMNSPFLFAASAIGISQVVVSDSDLVTNTALGGAPGIAGSAGGAAEGGGIFNDNQATVHVISSSQVDHNHAFGGAAAKGVGGGLCNLGAADVRGSELFGNQAKGGDSYANSGAAEGEGGGIANRQTSSFITDLDVVFGGLLQDNLALGGNASGKTTGADGVGGGIANEGGTVTFGGAIVFPNHSFLVGAASTIILNQAVGGSGLSGGRGLGGGIANLANGTLQVLLGSVSENKALGGRGTGGNSTAPGGGKGGDALGGGIANEGASTLTAVASAILFNLANGGNDGAGGNGGDGLGGGIHSDASGKVITFFVDIWNNRALGGSGAVKGAGTGGGVYDLGVYVAFFDWFLFNMASTSNNDIFL